MCSAPAVGRCRHRAAKHVRHRGWYARRSRRAREFRFLVQGTYGQNAAPRPRSVRRDRARQRHRKRGGAFDTAALTNPNGFAGLDGIFRLNYEGTVERASRFSKYRTGPRHVNRPRPDTFNAREKNFFDAFFLAGFSRGFDLPSAAK